MDRVSTHRLDMSNLEALGELLDSVAAQETVDVIVNNAYELSPRRGSTPHLAGSKTSRLSNGNGTLRRGWCGRR